MKKVLLSVTALLIGGALLGTSQLSDLLNPTVSARGTDVSYAQKMSLKEQQAHLRTIDPFDIDIIPQSRPIPEGVPVSSAFGMRVHPILHVEKMHTGIDFPAAEGTPVMATATGRVQTLMVAEDSSSYGTHIILEHDELYCTLYAHLSKVMVDAGQIVEEGDTIGLVGSTGRSTNPHLHYEVIRDGARVDPKDYL